MKSSLFFLAILLITAVFANKPDIQRRNLGPLDGIYKLEQSNLSMMQEGWEYFVSGRIMRETYVSGTKRVVYIYDMTFHDGNKVTLNMKGPIYEDTFDMTQEEEDQLPHTFEIEFEYEFIREGLRMWDKDYELLFKSSPALN